MRTFSHTSTGDSVGCIDLFSGVASSVDSNDYDEEGFQAKKHIQHKSVAGCRRHRLYERWRDNGDPQLSFKSAQTLVFGDITV